MDSSSEDEGDYTTTNVTLGYASTEPTGDDVSHIGGYPTWLNKAYTPPAALAKCKVCNGLTSLLLQLNADLQQHFPQDERRLHIFCCRRRACSRVAGSIRAIREVSKPQKTAPAKTEQPEKEKQPQQQQNQVPKQDLGSALFGAPVPNGGGGRANPFSLSSNTSQAQPANPFSSLPPTSSLAAKAPQKTSAADTSQSGAAEPPTATFADKLKISSSGTKADGGDADKPSQADGWPDESAFPTPFPRFFLDADAEQLEPEEEAVLPQVPQLSGSKYDVDDSPSSSAARANDKDTFESSLDKTFQRFSDRVAQNPEQVLRYEYGGQPLLYAGTDAVAARFVGATTHAGRPAAGPVRGMPRCEHCGARRVFELQLVPGLIYELEKDEQSTTTTTTTDLNLDDGMEWGTIIVGTCANNCGGGGGAGDKGAAAISFREEWVGVQWEERVRR